MLCFSLAVVTKERFIDRLDTDMVTIKRQLEKMDMLMSEIVRFIDPSILENLDRIKQQIEVGQILDDF